MTATIKLHRSRAPDDNCPHILVIDDDSRIRDLLARYLQEHGFRVTTAIDAASARATMRSLSFDLLILDVMMPHESGLDFARSLRRELQVPILMLTARAEPEQRIEGLETGVDDYLTKPFEPRELLLRVSNVLRRGGAAPATGEVRMGNFVFHIGRGELKCGNETVRLTERETGVVALLCSAARHAGVPPRARQGRGEWRRARHRRANQPVEAQDREGSRQPGLPADRAWQRLHSVPGMRVALPDFKSQLAGARSAYGRLATRTREWMPKGLYARALIIIIAPMVLLQSVITFVFLERHWETVTRRLSTGTVQNIAMLIDIYKSYPQDKNSQTLIKLANDDLGLRVKIVPNDELPQTRSRPFFDLLDRTLSDEITRQIGKPFWIDTVGTSNLVDIRIKLDNAVMHVLARRSQTYASNSQIFLLWMLGTSLVLLTVAILFLRNQIKPILRLAEAADSLGKGRPTPPDFRPRGAREVRQAAQAFIEMRDRIERHVEQRTTMLAGVSHDLRTVLTRFKLQLAMFEESPELDAMRADVDEMQAMLEDYVAFAKGASGEEIVRTDISEILTEVRNQAHGKSDIRIDVGNAPLVVPLRRHAFKRAVANLVNNAVRFADHVAVSAGREDGSLVVEVEDDGPGIPENERDQVFRPFYRLDDARNQDAKSTGLGLADRPRHRPHSWGRHRLERVEARWIKGCSEGSSLSPARVPYCESLGEEGYAEIVHRGPGADRLQHRRHGLRTIVGLQRRSGRRRSADPRHARPCDKPHHQRTRLRRLWRHRHDGADRDDRRADRGPLFGRGRRAAGT